MRIDAHVTFRKPTYLPEVLWPRLESNRFDGCIAVQPERDYWVLDAPYVLGAVFPAGSMAELDEAQRHSRFRGITDDGSHSLDFYRELERRHLSADINTTPERLLEIIDAAPSLHIVVPATSGLPSAPNLYAKIIAANRLLMDEMIATFGPEGILFGSNWPDCLATGPWKQQLATFTQAHGPRTMEVRSHMLGGAAMRAYRLT